VRPRTRYLVVAILAVLLLLLALGALPGLLRSGDPYYVTATPAAEGGLDADGDTAVNASDLSGERFPYTTAAVTDATADAPGRSGPYWRGPVGLKEAFTHSPFDELSSLRGRTATPDGSEAVYVRDNERLYRLAVTQEDDG